MRFFKPPHHPPSNPYLSASTLAISVIVSTRWTRLAILLPVTRLGPRLVPAIVVPTVGAKLTVVTTAVEHQTRTASYQEEQTNEP
jgi:hypothetical protein